MQYRIVAVTEAGEPDAWDVVVGRIDEEAITFSFDAEAAAEQFVADLRAVIDPHEK